jgi:hypothetical protein
MTGESRRGPGRVRKGGMIWVGIGKVRSILVELRSARYRVELPLAFTPPGTVMDISTYLDPTLTWFAGQLAWLSQVPPAYIAAAAVAPVLIALMARSLLATLWAALFALGAISLCAMEAAPWTLLATFEALAGFLLAFSAMIWGRRNRVVRDELDDLKRRLNQLEAIDDRKFMVSLRNPPQPRNSAEPAADEASR